MMSVKSNLEASVQIQSLLGALHDLEPVIFFFFSPEYPFCLIELKFT